MFFGVFGNFDPNTLDVGRVSKAKNTRLTARVFLRFPHVSQLPACLYQSHPNTENH